MASVLERLLEAGAVDDERFARRFAEDKRELRGWGPDRITEALCARGIDETLIEVAVGAEGAEAMLGRALETVEQSGIDPSDEPSRAMKTPKITLLSPTGRNALGTIMNSPTVPRRQTAQIAAATARRRRNQPSDRP